MYILNTNNYSNSDYICLLIISAGICLLKGLIIIGILTFDIKIKSIYPV